MATIEECLKRLDAAYHAGKVDGKDGDHAEYEKIKTEYPELAHAVAVAWWGD